MQVCLIMLPERVSYNSSLRCDLNASPCLSNCTKNRPHFSRLVDMSGALYELTSPLIAT